MIGPEHQVFQIHPWQSRTLLLTSSWVVVPLYVACDRGLWFHAVSSTGTYLCSVLYWYHPIHGWRRNLDLVYAQGKIGIANLPGRMRILDQLKSDPEF